MSYRQEVVIDVNATISAHAPDDLGGCIGCRQSGDIEFYPCPPVVFALRAADLLTRRLEAARWASVGPSDRRRSTAVETDLSRAVWRRSPACGDSAAGCVEVAFIDGAVALRNSDGPDGPIVIYTKQEWESFLQGVRDGDFIG